MATRGMQVEVPAFFRCPISLEVMSDPVTISTGHTFDRSNIQRWLQTGKKTCPATRQVLTTDDLIPNLTLQKCIRGWCVANNYRDGDKIPTSPRLLNEFHVKKLLDDVKMGSGRIESLKTLRNMAKSSERNRKIIVEGGSIAEMDTILSSHKKCTAFRVSEDRTSRDTFYSKYVDDECEEALGVLAVLSANEEAKQKIAVVGLRHLSALSWFLSRGSLDAKMNVAVILESLVMDDDSLTELGGEEGLMQGLVGLLKEDLYPKAITASLRSLYAICLPRRNRKKAVEAGAVSGVIELLPGAKRGIMEGAMALLELLSTCTIGRVALCEHALSLPAIVKTLSTVSSSIREHATSVLHAMLLQTNYPKLPAVAAQAGIFTHLLLVFQSECDLETKQKSQELLKLLQTTCKSNPCIRTIKYSS